MESYTRGLSGEREVNPGPLMIVWHEALQCSGDDCVGVGIDREEFTKDLKAR
jgi:hypothetical protein